MAIVSIPRVSVGADRLMGWEIGSDEAIIGAALIGVKQHLRASWAPLRSARLFPLCSRKVLPMFPVFVLPVYPVCTLAPPPSLWGRTEVGGESPPS